MTRVPFLAALILLFHAAPAEAQLYVFGREDRTDVVYTVNRADGRAKAVELLQAKKTGAIWRLIVESDVPGSGAVVSVSNGGANPVYFYSIGMKSEAEAIVDAREKARRHAAGKSGLGVTVHRSFTNTNRHPIEPPVPKYTTMGGVRGD